MSDPPFSAFDLVPSGIYRVVAPFIDFDGNVHPVAECWRYSSHNFVPYVAGLTLNVERDGANGTIRLQDYPEAQGAIIDSFSEFVMKIDPLTPQVLESSNK